MGDNRRSVRASGTTWRHDQMRLFGDGEMDEAKRRRIATTNHRQPIVVTGDARTRFANSELAGLIRNFGVGDIRSVSISTVWCDGEVGGSYHVKSQGGATLDGLLWRDFLYRPLVATNHVKG